MTTLLSKLDIELLPKPNEYHLVLADRLPPAELITAALALIFDGDRFLMTRLNTRGWDIPGGHIEPGESPEETVRREIYEETAVRVGPLHLLAYEQFIIHSPRPPDYKYPYPTSYQVFFWGKLVSRDPFAPTPEASECRLLTPDEARQTVWGNRGSALYEVALALAIKE